jgi:hypothetical protein
MVEYTMGGEHGGSNNDNNMTFQDVADAGNTEQPMMVVEQGVNNNDNNMPQTPPPLGAGAGASSSPKYVPRPPSPPPATKTPAIHRMITHMNQRRNHLMLTCS